jgi:hypothetical protein
MGLQTFIASRCVLRAEDRFGPVRASGLDLVSEPAVTDRPLRLRPLLVCVATVEALMGSLVDGPASALWMAGAEGHDREETIGTIDAEGQDEAEWALGRRTGCDGHIDLQLVAEPGAVGALGLATEEVLEWQAVTLQALAFALRSHPGR